MNIGLIDDHKLIRNGVKNLLNESGVNVVFEAENGLDMIKQLTANPNLSLPKMLIIDINMPEMDGFETVEWLNENYPDTKIIILTMYSDTKSILRMLNLGVNSYMLKNSSGEDLIKTLNKVNEKGNYFSEEIIKIMLNFISSGNISHNWIDHSQTFSQKEIRLIELICKEMPSKEIAAQLDISVRTVEGMVFGILSKMNVKSRVGIALFAQKYGLIKF